MSDWVYVFLFHTNEDASASDVKIFERILSVMLREFTRYDSNNDRALDLDEFAGFGAVLFDAVSFFRKSFKVGI